MSLAMDIGLKRDELAAKMGGGIPRNSLCLLEGPDGSGKSIVAQRLTYGLIQHGYSVTYVSTEMNTIEFIEQMSSLKYDINDALLNDNLLFIPMFPFFGDAQLDEDFMDRILASRKVFEKEVVIFDTLSYMIVKDKLSKERQFDVMKFLKKINTMDKTVIFCVDPKHLNEDLLSLIRNTSDVFFELEIKMVLGNLLRIMNTTRFKRSPEEVAAAIPFKVLPKVGLAIELASLS